MATRANALQQLIGRWLDAHPGESIGDLARRVHAERNTFYALYDRDEPKRMPSQDTMKKLANALEVPYRTVVEAAVEATYKVRRLPVDQDTRVQALAAIIEQVPEDAADQIVRLARTYLPPSGSSDVGR